MTYRKTIVSYKNGLDEQRERLTADGDCAAMGSMAGLLRCSQAGAMESCAFRSLKLSRASHVIRIVKGLL